VTLAQAVTLAIAVLGAVLGLINTWHAIVKDRVKLRVVPAWAFGAFAEGRDSISVEVVNLGMIPVTIAEVGFKLRGAKDQRLVQPDAFLIQGGSLPYRLEPRTAVTVVFIPTFLADKRFAEVDLAYARTQCGRVLTGTSGALRQIVDRARRDAA
jgi:hypothetical protein